MQVWQGMCTDHYWLAPQSMLHSGCLTNMDPIFELFPENSPSLHPQVLVMSLPKEGTALTSGDTVRNKTKLISALKMGRWVIVTGYIGTNI